MVGTEEAPLDVSVPETDVEHLAVGLWVGVVAVGATVAGEAQVGGDLNQVLGEDEANGQSAAKES